MRLFGRDDGQGTVQEIMNGFLNRTDGIAKRQRVFTAEKQAFIDFAAECGGKLDVDTELTGFGQTVAQTAAGQAVQALCATARIVFGIGLQFGLAFDVVVEEFGAHAACRQTGNRHEFNHFFSFRTGQRFLEVDVGITFFGNGKRGTDLDGGRAPVFQGCFDFFQSLPCRRRVPTGFFRFPSPSF